MPPTLDIIIVNWNGGELLRRCLESLAAVHRDGFSLARVVVVDNASADRSADGLDGLDLPLEVIRNRSNIGFAAACNQGARSGTSDYLLFLNPDTRLCEDSLSKPLAFMEQADNQRVGIVGIQLVDDAGIVCRSCARLPTPRRFFIRMLGLDRLFPNLFPSHFMTDWDHGENREVDHVMGAFFLVRRSLFEKLNGFDERFFVYLEDVDFSFRARQTGWRSYYLADARAYHKGGGTSKQVSATRLHYSLQSRIQYGYKHFTWWSATALMLGTLLFEPWLRIASSLLHLSSNQLRETLKAYGSLWSTAVRGWR